MSVSLPILLLLAVPGAAAAALKMAPGSLTVVPSSYQAGAHGDLTTSFAFAKDEAGSVEGLLRNVEVVLPLGFAGYPVAAMTCDPVQLQLGRCPVDSQVGTLEIVFRLAPGFYGVFDIPLFNMQPSLDQTAVYGWGLLPDASGEVIVSVGPDYRARARATDIFSVWEVVRQSLTVWGVPASGAHDAQRGSEFRCEQHGGHEHFTPGEEHCAGGGIRVNENTTPYLVNPTQCTASPLQADLVGLESWESERLPTELARVGPFTGCESLKFAPTISVAPEVTQATTPTGYEVDLNVPQTEGAEGLATADLRDAVVQDARGRRALALGGDRAGIVQRSAGRARHRTASGMPQRLQSSARSR